MRDRLYNPLPFLAVLVVVAIVVGSFLTCDEASDYERKADHVLHAVTNGTNLVMLPEYWVNTITHVTNVVSVQVFYVRHGNPARTDFSLNDIRKLRRSDNSGYDWLGDWLDEELTEWRRGRR